MTLKQTLSKLRAAFQVLNFLCSPLWCYLVISIIPALTGTHTVPHHHTPLLNLWAKRMSVGLISYSYIQLSEDMKSNKHNYESYVSDEHPRCKKLQQNLQICMYISSIFPPMICFKSSSPNKAPRIKTPLVLTNYRHTYFLIMYI